jgi:peroxiredoxin
VESTTFVSIGDVAPDFRAPTSNGQTLDRASFLGKVPVVLLFPAPDDADLAATLAPFDTRMVEFGHRRVQVLAVVEESPRNLRELAARIPLHALTVLADQDGSIREAYAPEGGQCFVMDLGGRLRAVVPLGADAVDELLGRSEALTPAAGTPADRGVR